MLYINSVYLVSTLHTKGCKVYLFILPSNIYIYWELHHIVIFIYMIACRFQFSLIAMGHDFTSLPTLITSNISKSLVITLIVAVESRIH